MRSKIMALALAVILVFALSFWAVSTWLARTTAGGT